MPTKEHDRSSVLSIRLPDEIIQRLDRYLDWRETHQRPVVPDLKLPARARVLQRHAILDVCLFAGFIRFAPGADLTHGRGRPSCESAP